MSKKPFLILVVFVVFSMVVMPSHAQETTCSESYTVQADDWLSKVAERYLGDMMAYLSIVEATNAMASTDESFVTINNPDLIEIGQKLCIPSEAEATTEKKSTTVDEAGSEEETMVDQTLVRQPEGDIEAFWDEFDWTDLTEAEQALWGQLGWDEASWQEETEAPASKGALWSELTDEERTTAEQLGYNEQLWGAIE